MVLELKEYLKVLAIKKRYWLLILLVLLIGKYASCAYQRGLRNVIRFENDVHSVIDSLRQINVLLPKLEGIRGKSQPCYYWIRDNSVFINSSKLRNDTVVIDSVFTLRERNHFLKLAYYLNRNHVNGAFKFGTRNWYFDYRSDDYDMDYIGLRYLLFGNNVATAFNNQQIKFIDSTNGLYLLKMNPNYNHHKESGQ